MQRLKITSLEQRATKYFSTNSNVPVSGLAIYVKDSLYVGQVVQQMDTLGCHSLETKSNKAKVLSCLLVLANYRKCG